MSFVTSAWPHAERFRVLARLQRVPLPEAHLSSQSLKAESLMCLSPSLHFR